MIKRLLVYVMLIFLLCGCTSSDSAKINLKFSTWGSASEISVIKILINKYELQNPGVKITLMHFPQNYFKKIHLLFASKTEPDIILINNQNLKTYYKYLLTIDNNISEDFFPNALSCLSINGELKSVPRDISNLVIYYNKTLLNKYNIPYPAENWTIHDLIQTASKLKNYGIYAIALENDLFFTYPFILSKGENPDKLTDSNLEEYDSIAFYKSLSRKFHYCPEEYELGQRTTAEFFLNGQSAFYLSGRWMTPKIRELANFDWDIVRFPAGENGSVVPCDATGWAVSARSKNKDEALKFVQFLASTQSLNEIAKSGLIVPARISSAYSKNFITSPPENVKLFIELAFKSHPIEYSVDYNRMKDKIDLKLKK